MQAESRIERCEKGYVKADSVKIDLIDKVASAILPPVEEPYRVDIMTWWYIETRPGCDNGYHVRIEGPSGVFTYCTKEVKIRWPRN
jgi:hypothetical protein